MLVGIAVAVPGWSGYYPIAHEGGGNMDEKSFKMVSRCTKYTSYKIFHNAMYDVCWIKALSLSVSGRIVDTMIASALVDENQMRYDLNNCSKRYTGKTKNERIYMQLQKIGGLTPKQKCINYLPFM